MWRQDWEQLKKNLTVERIAWNKYEEKRALAKAAMQVAIEAKRKEIEEKKKRLEERLQKFIELKKREYEKKVKQIHEEYMKQVERKFKPSVGF